MSDGKGDKALRAEVERLRAENERLAREAQQRGLTHPVPGGASPVAPRGTRAPRFAEDAPYRAKLTAELELAAGLGVPWDVVAAHGGISDRTLREYIAKGKAGVEPYVDLYERLRAARARNEVRTLGVQYRIASLQVEVVEEEIRPDGTRVTRRMPADPGALSAIQRASAWILEHVHGYYRTERQIIDVPGATSSTPRSDAEVQAYLDRVAERKRLVATQGGQEPEGGGEDR
jgi:hypothetical protein